MAESASASSVTLSICVPVFNEARTIGPVLERLISLDPGFTIEIIAVDDGSTDDSRNELGRIAALTGKDAAGKGAMPRLRILSHPRNLGKSAALSTAISAARGRVIAIQDADLEYDPADIVTLAGVVIEGRSDAVFGSRYLPGSRRCSRALAHTLANRFLTTLSNLSTGLRLTDMETCRKVFRSDAIGRMPFLARRFAVEPEICARLAANGRRVTEMPISYDPRGRAAGKKIGWRDGIEAIWWIIRLRWFSPRAELVMESRGRPGPSDAVEAGASSG